MKGTGLCDHTYLCDIYFSYYKRVWNIALRDDTALVEKALQVAIELHVDYDYRYTGYGDDSAFLPVCTVDVSYLLPLAKNMVI